MRARLLTVAAVLVIAAAGVLLYVTLGRGGPRNATALATVSSYLQALSDNDRDALTELAEPYGRGATTGERAMVDAQLKRYGGKRVLVESLTFVNALWMTSGGACQAVFRGVIGGGPASFVVGMQLKPEGGWQVTSVDEQFPRPDTPACS
ncbi:hypothetical protein [Dactylosporangium sp. NPDC050588]|uniref:hypothetical protein n=1 Tax=Dactylosporangium sp. NPDC050588 TaxID=3157211 RepID=UPI0033F99D2A